MKYFFFILLVSLIGFTAKGQTKPVNQKTTADLTPNKVQTYVVIVAIADYEYGTAQQGDLRYTKNDALKFYDFLTRKTGWEIPQENIVLLLDQEATKVNILATLGSVFKQAKTEDRILFYYTGHGLADYIMPYDAQPKAVNYLSYDEIKAIFRLSKASTKLAIIDACFANSIKTKSIKKKASEKPKVKITMPTEQVIIMASAQSYQTSREYGNLKQGVFSYFLLAGLEGRADKNKDRIITIGELHQFVYHNVKAYTHNNQKPHTFGSFKIDMPLVIMKK